VTPVAIVASASLGPYAAGESPVETPLATPRARKMMSRSAYLAARCLADLLPPLTTDRTAIAYFLGVGGSAGSLDDVVPLLAAASSDDAFSLPAFGTRGLAACNPLLAFQLMNNFTMCHGAILEGLGGPNGAIFSRGAGTVAALAEAMHAIRAGDATCAIAGGADVATHPVTLAELARDGHLARGLLPADGAALLALAAATSSDDVILEGCAHASGRGRAIDEALDDARARCRAPGTPSTVVLVPWGPPAAAGLAAYAASRFANAVVEIAARGETLAASAALAVVAAASALRAAPGRTLVLTLGVDGDPGAVALSRGAA
jgi:Beta-ketoacyl synthase, N-terminal domain